MAAPRRSAKYRDPVFLAVQVEDHGEADAGQEEREQGDQEVEDEPLGKKGQADDEPEAEGKGEGVEQGDQAGAAAERGAGGSFRAWRAKPPRPQPRRATEMATNAK